MDSSSQIPKTKFKIMFIYSIALFSIFIAHNIFVEFIYIHKLNVGGQVFPSINRLKSGLEKWDSQHLYLNLSLAHYSMKI